MEARWCEDDEGKKGYGRGPRERTRTEKNRRESWEGARRRFANLPKGGILSSLRSFFFGCIFFLSFGRLVYNTFYSFLFFTFVGICSSFRFMFIQFSVFL